MKPETKSAKIYSEALRFLGTEEVDGPSTNPLIKKWILASASWLDPDDSKTSWCGCFRAAVGFTTATGVPAAPYRALNWSHWGEPVKTIREAIQGDTVVLQTSAGFHVTLFSSLKESTFVGLGGNQANSVKLSTFPVSKIVAIRR